MLIGSVGLDYVRLLAVCRRVDDRRQLTDMWRPRDGRGLWRKRALYVWRLGHGGLVGGGYPVAL
jgi:hypothetical protein